ncbi:hypothetical protein A3K82_03670 [Candidatus Pacearchaeota archaeon RBG_19FT_COMBO_34_9]|nr:MAG: hypothetical protein A3K82_03670 [Candidatus Pacearchaeota archaeon RBG_19FT_COMBO_34_9]OGJ16144.1 MAG: hypothetical protein A3K74_02850 [Candidatus Pacearchaeota archaeon RBG_13_33_26]
MKAKTFSLFALSVLAVLVLASCVSALDISTTTTELTQTDNSFTINVAGGTGSEVITISASSVKDYTNKEIIFKNGSDILPSDVTLEASGDGLMTIDYTVPTGFNFFGKPYSVTITAKNASETVLDTRVLTFTQTPFYDGDNDGGLSVTSIDFDTLKGFGDDEDYWYPLDEVEITFTVKNDGNWKIKKIQIEACLWDKTAGKCVFDDFDEDDMEINNNKFDLKSGKKQDVTMTLKVDADNLKKGNTDYTFYVKAVGEIDEGDKKGDTTGDSELKEDIEIRIDDDFVVLDNIEVSESASCGGEVQITADVWNIGEEDQEDVYIMIYSKELGINKKVEIGDIDSLDNEKLDVTITLPDNAEEKKYDLTLMVFDEDDDIYKNDEKDKAEFLAPLIIESGSCSTVPSASITASLQSDAKAGGELIVKAVIINTGSESKTFTVSASNYADWASSATLDKNSVTLGAGESQEVLITLKVNKDVSGDKKFNIELVEGNKFLSQPVSVTIDKSSAFPSLTGFFAGIGGDNWYLWGIGALNVLLVLVIIIVAMKVAKKKE